MKKTEALSQVLGRRDPTGLDRGGFFLWVLIRREDLMNVEVSIHEQLHPDYPHVIRSVILPCSRELSGFAADARVTERVSLNGTGTGS